MNPNGLFSRLFFQKSAPVRDAEIIQCPLSGLVVPLESVADKAFADKLLGDGLALLPSDGRVYAPFDGTAVSVSPVKHTLSLQSFGGVELLIHVGLDTVLLRGRHFDMRVSEGQSVSRGQLLLEFDLRAILLEGYDLTTPVVLINGLQYSMQKLGSGKILHGEPLLSLCKA